MVSRSELDHYLKENIEVDSVEFDILRWWKVKSSSFPVLFHMARDILAILFSTVASESAFSFGVEYLTNFVVL